MYCLCVVIILNLKDYLIYIMGDQSHKACNSYKNTIIFVFFIKKKKVYSNVFLLKYMYFFI